MLHFLLLENRDCGDDDDAILTGIKLLSWL
jgi:hypothetical protein